MADAGSFHRWSYVVLMVLGGATSLYCLAAIGAWLARERWMGRLIVNAGKPPSKFRVYSWIFYALLWAAAAFSEPAHFPFSFSTVILISLGTPLLIGDALEIREGGIFSDALIISWNRVKDWRWEHAGGGKQVQWSGKVEPGPAIMKVELVKPLFFRRIVQIRVPYAQVDAVEHAVSAKVPVR